MCPIRGDILIDMLNTTIEINKLNMVLRILAITKINKVRANNF